jgi:hypothetical protein
VAASPGWPGPRPGHRAEDRLGLDAREIEVRGLGDFPFGIGDDDPCLLADGRAVLWSSSATAAQLPSSRSSAWATVGSPAP